MKKKYIYDINYRLKTTSVFSVVASSAAEARRIALEELENMSKQDLVERFLAALDFEPNFQITYIGQVEKLKPEEEEFFNR